jgi:hypothetical protein
MQGYLEEAMRASCLMYLQMTSSAPDWFPIGVGAQDARNFPVLFRVMPII